MKIANGMKVYVAGPIESVGGNMNEPLFDFVAKKLREQGCEVMNPWDVTRELVGSRAKVDAMNKEERKELRKQLLAKEIVWIIQNADYVVMLPGWERSRGATAEHAVAQAIDVTVYVLPAKVSLMQDGVDIFAA